VADRQRLAVAAEQDLLVRDQAGQADRVHANVIDRGASGAGEFLLGGVRGSA
jgi:hypothetical protein